MGRPGGFQPPASRLLRLPPRLLGPVIALSARPRSRRKRWLESGTPVRPIGVTLWYPPAQPLSRAGAARTGPGSQRGVGEDSVKGLLQVPPPQAVKACITGNLPGLGRMAGRRQLHTSNEEDPGWALRPHSPLRVNREEWESTSAGPRPVSTQSPGSSASRWIAAWRPGRRPAGWKPTVQTAWRKLPAAVSCRWWGTRSPNPWSSSSSAPHSSPRCSANGRTWSSSWPSSSSTPCWARRRSSGPKPRWLP